MSGALPKTKSSQSSLSRTESSAAVEVQNSSSEFSFELKPKPKLTCIPETCSRLFNDHIRKTQSLNVASSPEMPGKSWSVLFIGSKSNLQAKSVIM